MTDVLDCPVCTGVGVLDAPVRTCPSCDGTGIVTVEQYMRLRGYPKGMDHLPALLDLAEAELGIPANRKAGIEGEETDEWWAERTRLYELRKSALAALKRSVEG